MTFFDLGEREQATATATAKTAAKTATKTRTNTTVDPSTSLGMTTLRCDWRSRAHDGWNDSDSVCNSQALVEWMGACDYAAGHLLRRHHGRSGTAELCHLYRHPARKSLGRFCVAGVQSHSLNGSGA